MEDCSNSFEVLDQTSWYCLLLDTVSIFSLVINISVIYCIVYRSHKSLQRYKWFLLWHQCITFFTDVMVSTFLHSESVVTVQFGRETGTVPPLFHGLSRQSNLEYCAH